MAVFLVPPSYAGPERFGQRQLSQGQWELFEYMGNPNYPVWKDVLMNVDPTYGRWDRSETETFVYDRSTGDLLHGWTHDSGKLERLLTSIATSMFIGGWLNYIGIGLGQAFSAYGGITARIPAILTSSYGKYRALRAAVGAAASALLSKDPDWKKALKWAFYGYVGLSGFETGMGGIFGGTSALTYVGAPAVWIGTAALNFFVPGFGDAVWDAYWAQSR